MATRQDVPSFSAAPVSLAFDGLLFDMDGTIVDSTDAIVKYWYELGKQLGVDPEEILETSHGRRSIETLALYDKSLANWEYVKKVEGRVPYDFGKDAVEVPGARALLASLDKVGAPWMIVTSGTTPLCTGWLDVMKMAKPEVLVVAEDVSVGKPDPECYLLGRKRLGLSEKASVLVLEDSPSGVIAGKAAGFTVVGLATTHAIEKIQAAGADFIVKDLRSVTMQSWDGSRVQIQIVDALAS